MPFSIYKEGSRHAIQSIGILDLTRSIETRRNGEADFLHELLCLLFRVIDGDPQKGHLLWPVLVSGLFDNRRFLSTRTAPGREKINDDRGSLMLTQLK